MVFKPTLRMMMTKTVSSSPHRVVSYMEVIQIYLCHDLKKNCFWDKDSFSFFLCKLLCVNWSQGQADDFFKTWELSLDTTCMSFKSQQLKHWSISRDWLLTRNRGNGWPYCMTCKNLPASILFNPHSNQEVVWLGSAYANHILVSVFMSFIPAVFRILLSALHSCVFFIQADPWVCFHK